MMEEWRPVVGFEGRYDVSDAGRIRNPRTGLILRLSPDSSGYLGCTLRNAPAKAKYMRACQAVVRAFMGPRPHPDWQVAHGPRGQRDDSTANLRWTSPTDNARDRIRQGTQLRGETIGTSTLNVVDVERIRDLRRAGCSLPKIGKWIGTSHSNVDNIAQRRTWAHV